MLASFFYLLAFFFVISRPAPRPFVNFLGDAVYEKRVSDVSILWDRSVDAARGTALGSI
jgi:hypothetical protein